MASLEISIQRGKEILSHLDELAALRIQVFREWPYLYDGALEYERKYLAAYANCEESVVVLARAGSRIVGASTALPLEAAGEEFRSAFLGSGYSIPEVFYFGESVLLPEFRGRGVGREFFMERESAALAYGSRMYAFCAVNREASDLRRPEAYRPLEAFWTKLGYCRQPDLQARLKWRVVDGAGDCEHTLTFWIKKG